MAHGTKIPTESFGCSPVVSGAGPELGFQAWVWSARYGVGDLTIGAGFFQGSGEALAGQRGFCNDGLLKVCMFSREEAGPCFRKDMQMTFAAANFGSCASVGFFSGFEGAIGSTLNNF